jgi:hypothetical protein
MTTSGASTAALPPNHHPPPPSSFKPTGTTLDPTTWAPAPPFLLPDPDASARIARRNANHHMYRSIGTNSIWHKYLDLGYYVFDDCMDFQRAWKSTSKEAITNRYKTIWKSFHIHRMHDLPVNDNLQKSAINKVRPYLQSKDPDFLLATDIEFEEKEFFANKDLGTRPNNPNDEGAWKEVSSKKNKKKSPPSSPRTTPITATTVTQELGIEDMEISDDVLLKLSLARQIPLPADIEDQPFPDPQVEKPPLIHNPYKNRTIQHTASVSKTHTTPKATETIDQQHNNPKTTSNLSTPASQTARLPNISYDISTPGETQTANPHSTFIDLLDEASTQSTTGTAETTRQHGTSNARSVYSQFQKPNEHIPINDGTLRITVRWKPNNYEALIQDEELWTKEAVEMLQDILKHPLSPISLVPWQEKVINNSKMTKVTSLEANSLKQLCSPKVSNLESYNMSVFGIRICATDPAFSTGTWLKDSTVQESLANHRVELNISNSTCDSGKMVVAGVILLKHPKFTHRLYYLLSLRRQLPTNTPFFDIGTHQRTQNGIASPHLVVKCGENHQETLTEILSDHLDGTQTTAIYIGTKVLQSMTQEATEDLFDTHQKYVNSIQRLPLSPQVVNIDRNREEHNPDSAFKHNRSTRAWANSILTPEGKPLQCDAENGGKDKKAYLLVPSHLIPIIQPILQRYKQHIRPPITTRSLNAGENTRDRPDEIYVPTASVQRNVDFLKNMSAAAIWKNAPSAIRQGGPPQPPNTTRTTSKPYTTDKNDTSTTTNNSATPIRHGNPKNNVLESLTREPTNTRINTQEGQNSRQTNQPYIRPMDDNTTATFHSTASTTLNSSQHAQRFSELEASIKTNQQNLHTMNKQHETMEARILETMSSCHENTKQLVVMQGQLNNLQSTMQIIAEQMQQITNHFAQPPGQQYQETQMRSPVKKKQRQANNQTSSSPSSISDVQEQHDADHPPPTTDREDSSQQAYTCFTPQTHHKQNSADQEKAQYNEKCFPGTAMEE